MTANRIKTACYTTAEKIAALWAAGDHQGAVDLTEKGIHGMTSTSRALLPVLAFRKLQKIDHVGDALANSYLARFIYEQTGA